MEFTNNEELFKQLRKKPDPAIPTIILMVVCHCLIAYSWISYLSGNLSLLTGCLINSIAMYFLFSPLHDAMHNAVFTKKRDNVLFLAATVFPILPFSSGLFLRMMHMQHHRFTNEELDPDHYLSKNYKTQMKRWPFWGIRYICTYKKYKEHYPKFPRYHILYDYLAPLAVIIPLLIVKPMATIFLWLIPVLVMKYLICAVFMFLPHIPHLVTHKEDPYQATLIRKGYEWFLTPVLAYQNYHLVHHLYPTVPFYRYIKIWRAKEKYHMSFNPAMVPAFSLKRPDLPN